MKALPIFLFFTAICFGIFEFEHGRLHDAVQQNTSARIENIQKPTANASPRLQVRPIKPGVLGIGARATDYAGRPAGSASTPTQAPTTPAPSLDNQVDEAKDGTKADNAILAQSERRMFIMRAVVTAVVLPLCLLIIVLKTRFDGKDRNFAYGTVVAVVSFWLRT
jgi:hypothetical protein